MSVMNPWGSCPPGGSHLDIYLSLIVRLMKCAKGKSSMSPASGAIKGSIPFSKRGADINTHEGQMWARCQSDHWKISILCAKSSKNNQQSLLKISAAHDLVLNRDGVENTSDCLHTHKHTLVFECTNIPTKSRCIWTNRCLIWPSTSHS